MDNTSIEIIKLIGAMIGYILSTITLTTMIVKPIRKRFINWLKNICGTGVIESNLTEIKSEFGEIKAMLQTHIEADTDKSELLKRLAEAEKAALRNSILQLCDICLKRESITSVEKLNLIDMYREYHNLGGDTYCTDRYEITLDLPEKN